VIVYDDIDRHIAAAGSIDRAATPIGMYLAWCVNLSLVSDELAAAAGRELLRVQIREITGAELLIRVCRGRLDSTHLSSVGQDFTARRYEEYLAAYATTFGVEPRAIYSVENTWDHYDRIAPLLTRWHLGEPARESEHWWQRLAPWFHKKR
jgi:hypothetical protein